MVLVHRRAAAGGVREDRIHVLWKRVEVASGEALRGSGRRCARPDRRSSPVPTARSPRRRCASALRSLRCLCRDRAPAARSRPATPRGRGVRPRGIRCGQGHCVGSESGTRSSIGRRERGTSGRMTLANLPKVAARRNRGGIRDRLRGQQPPQSLAKRVAKSAFASARNGLMRSRYGTPLGQAGSHARHPRQRSTCGCAAVQSSVPSSTSFIRTMRPRGVSISWPNSR